MSCPIALSQKITGAVKVIQIAWLKNHPRCCPICMDPLNRGVGCVDTPCGHKFCLPCYVRLDKPSCPMCRADTPLAEPKLPAGAVLFDRAKAVRSANRRAAERHTHRQTAHTLNQRIIALEKVLLTFEDAAQGAMLGKTKSAPTVY